MLFGSANSPEVGKGTLKRIYRICEKTRWTKKSFQAEIHKTYAKAYARKRGGEGHCKRKQLRAYWVKADIVARQKLLALDKCLLRI